MRNTTTLMAARRYLTNVLFELSIDAEHMSVLHFIQLLDYFAEHPHEYHQYKGSTSHSST